MICCAVLREVADVILYIAMWNEKRGLVVGIAFPLTSRFGYLNNDFKTVSALFLVYHQFIFRYNALSAPLETLTR